MHASGLTPLAAGPHPRARLPQTGLAHYATPQVKLIDESHVISARWDNVCILVPPHSQDIMALPKSMRILAGATICVFLFLFVKIMNAPSAGELQVPTKVPLSKDGQWDHDPQEDRKYILGLR